jgi:lipoprotein-anchoring transpeptidase ErfK/SrfK
MRWSALVAAALLAVATQAKADLLIQVDKGTQRMTVYRDGEALARWPVSTGVAKYDTPDGRFTPFRMEKEHFSKEWDDAPMPYSIFFTKQGHAIHGTNHTSIGRPASHGCVRLSVAHAAQLWDLVKAEGMNKTKVVLTGELPTSDLIAKRGRTIDEDLTTGSVPQDGGYARYYDSGRGTNGSGYDDDSRSTRYYDNGGGYYAPPSHYVYRERTYPYYPRSTYRNEWAPPPPPPPFFPFGGR